MHYADIILLEYIKKFKFLFIGRQFDKNGNMIEWWDSKTIYTFREKAQCMVDQYSKYKMQEVNLHVNGRMTQGENIADNGGLKQSFRVYKFINFVIIRVQI